MCKLQNTLSLAEICKYIVSTLCDIDFMTLFVNNENNLLWWNPVDYAVSGDNPDGAT